LRDLPTACRCLSPVLRGSSRNMSPKTQRGRVAAFQAEQLLIRWLRWTCDADLCEETHGRTAEKHSPHHPSSLFLDEVQPRSFEAVGRTSGCHDLSRTTKQRVGRLSCRPNKWTSKRCAYVPIGATSPRHRVHLQPEAHHNSRAAPAVDVGSSTLWSIVPGDGGKALETRIGGGRSSLEGRVSLMVSIA